MSIPDGLVGLEGSWYGKNTLHLGDWEPDNPILESNATAEVRRRSGDQFLEISYTWSYKGEPKEGVILLGINKKTGTVNGVWTDSWHLAHQLMLCEGRTTDSGSVDVKGSYKVDGHPDWGWRTEIIPGNGSMRCLMFNVSPEDKEELAVDMELSRA